ncbi:uncharacterized protein LOC128982124 [Macrosteles quadrilineatus]|uniref:uncharacterized protein LOC128982124 n=1 Tax=Macrosteles quadrilineatus TaxID=74068 RepID=UPI0023E13429|nr:uncharacterized protein LOC128982124 [Macrosteles quadrilineatus]
MKKSVKPSNKTQANSTTQLKAPVPQGFESNTLSAHVDTGAASHNCTVLLATALVKISTSNGHNIIVRAVLYSASQTSIISEHCASMIHIQRSSVGVHEIKGIASARIKPKGLSFVNISSLNGKTLATAHPVLILDRITNDMPSVKISSEIKAQIKEYALADPNFDTPGHLLIGADLFAQTIIGSATSLGDRMPYTINTIFGYVVLGNVPTSQDGQTFSGLTTLLSINDLTLHETLQRFWALEEPPACSKLSPEEMECEDHFLKTHSRDETGRYVCCLPFKENPVKLGNSSTVALQTFKSLEHDALLGSDTVEEAAKLQQDVINLLRKGGFELRKWASNNSQILENLPPQHCLSTDSPCVSILGLKWNPHSDTFSYAISEAPLIFTKRAILSSIAKIYDVTGMLTPVIFWAKALMQHIWSLGLDWDNTLPSDIIDRWSTFVNELPEIENLEIGRYISLSDAVNIQLHGFSDASELGFAGCVYLRTENPQGSIYVNLLIAKSRVAPLKRITIPRLELCGAHILAKLLHYCVDQLSDRYKIDSVTAWSDSTVALSWIHTPSHRLKLYVANRVAQIQELTPSCIWKHISTLENPADVASRGLTPSLLIHNKLWWSGPTWLKSSSDSWPQPSSHLPEEELPEIKTTTLNLLTIAEDQDLKFINKFSSWTKLLHVMGYVLRFISCLKTKQRITHSLTLEELEVSNKRICWLVQRESFSEDINSLSKKNVCSSRIQRLSPFMDDEGLLRVGGRLKHSELPYSAKHQIILPKDHFVVNLIIDYHHRIFLHCGPTQLQAVLREKYWILSARSIIRSRIFKRLRCFRMKPKPNTPLMGDLPSPRVVATRPFNVTGVDYAGPFTVKLYVLKRLQPIKVYLCLFVCFATKAVHLEVVSDLSSEAYIAALTRFISRRGSVKEIHSDCGTNFVGEAAALHKCFNNLLCNPVTHRFAEENNISFKFLPPHAPHQGGLWERAVRSAKHHLHRVIGGQILTYEEFITLVSRVEAILNSRPLTPLSGDPNDLESLTPGHFLTGGPLKSMVEPQYDETSCNRLRRWQLVQAFSQHIWTRWSQEYLHTLQHHSKWTSKTENLKIGDLVVIHEPNTPPLQWKLARITAVSPGADGIVRVVHLRTATGNFSRPTVKVSLLPTN